jgi:16S rRNA pseudouridine516 synthase
MRLDRFIGSRLACSARTAQHMIAAREVLLNGVPATDGSQAVSRFCRVEVAGRVLRARESVHLMLHKPRGCVSATTDRKHPTVLDLIEHCRRVTSCTSRGGSTSIPRG